MEEPRIYTVTELTKDIRFVLEDTFHEVWIEGEVSNLTVSAAGHAYFSLKDESSLLNCVLFKSNGIRLGFSAEDGMSVLARGRVSVYDKRGQYQLYVTRMEPRGRGALQVAFEQLKARLQKEGLFNEEHKRPIPFLPARVGVVTSPTGAAIRDILKVSKRRYNNIEITLRPVKVQGEDAAGEIARAIRELNEFNEWIASSGAKEHPVDVMIVGRGGGSLEDLWAFNEEPVARAIYDSDIPVISAVGHQIDFTISDFVADCRAATPSHAAELAVPTKEELSGRIRQLGGILYSAVNGMIDRFQREVLSLRSSYVLRAPMNVFLQMEQRVDELARSAASSIKHLCQMRRARLGAAAGKLEALSPLAVLERGYSITFKGKDVIKKASDLAEGDLIRTVFASGKVASRVEKIEKQTKER
ncbi:MAG: exodeoxyribonuclease VII large subunit [Candidatus Omnitrophica bacterium]|nr:exodeoxyribonuclease VII large subunit [Candidatus Omnitrophota bacterium]